MNERILDTVKNIVSYCNEVSSYNSFLLGKTRIRVIGLKSHTRRGTYAARIALFNTNDDGCCSGSAIEIDDEWYECDAFSSKNCIAVRFNSPDHQHSGEYIREECTPISSLILDMLMNSKPKQIEEDVVYTTLNLAKKQGLI